MAEDWIDLATGQRLTEPTWIVEARTCPGCAFIESKTSELGSDEAAKKHRHVRLRRAIEADFDPPSAWDD